MPPFLENLKAKALLIWNDSSVSQRIMVGGLAFSMVLVFFLLLYWMGRPDYAVLYDRLAPEDANRVVSTLQTAKEPFRLTDNGQTILVPVDRVHELRLRIAGEGALRGSGLGFEIFDDVKLGQTDFIQRINYQRALQGELSRTISEFPEVDSARIHLVIPHRSLFIEEQSPPSAAVILTMRQGARLESRQVQSVVNLVTSAVEGLTADHITVSDTSGRVLYQPKASDTFEGLSSTQLEYKLQLEQTLERRIDQMLIPLFGHGQVIAKVNTDLDFSHRTIRKEMFDPDSAVVRSEQKSDEASSGQSHLDGGVPEPQFRGEGFAGHGTLQESTRSSSTINFEIDREEQQIIMPMGQLQRLSVAVIVDGIYEAAPDGSGHVFIPRSAEELQRIEQLVRNAIGYDGARGDSVEVSSISFGGPEVLPAPGLADIILDYGRQFGKPILNFLLVLLFLLLVLRPVVLAMIRPRVAEQDDSVVEGLPSGDMQQMALEEAEALESETVLAQRRMEQLKQQTEELLQKNMEQSINVLKIWLKEENA
ncbi:flagellar M-ring protein FliF [Desulfonatronum thiosulfatophilum]|uniref:Flagellar M-ring protein n=1 Tax=Desulfonatronum thiosulfatophilum TaxID=617002 RepID=A0A1G6AV28_9BACT|nr:flagellar basal-body MS-ring/collar protein FliF [Desulfonatronum thiosulfatophilum]SDB12267.1 flagellar M-ring protein FliF [Desulfonatronum thiosulfatophilum]